MQMLHTSKHSSQFVTFPFHPGSVFLFINFLGAVIRNDVILNPIEKMASNHSNSCLIYFLFQLALSIILAAFTSIHVSSAPSGETSSESFVSSPESEISSSEQDTEVKMITKRAAPGYGPSGSGYSTPSNGYGYENSYGKSDSDEEYDPDDYNPDDDMGYQGGSGDGNENDYYEYKGYK